jgi:DNA polymerase IV
MTKLQVQKKIIHIDMDAFYASVEQLDNPDLKGKPVAVGGGSERGVVAAASYEAREFGVRSAMSGKIAKNRCPELIFVVPRFDRYKEISGKIREIFYEYSDLVEPLSLDEAFIDVTENKKNNPSAGNIATEIRKRIYDELGLRASAGISINKFTAKIASDINKPNGQKTIKPNEVIPFLEKLPIEKFFGVGKVTAKKMNKLGIYNGDDLKSKNLSYLIQHFGKHGRHYYDIVRGVQHSVVVPNRIRKSIATENTFTNDIIEVDEILEQLTLLANELEKRMMKNNVKGKTITVKIKYNDFTQQTRSKTLGEFTGSKKSFFGTVESLVLQEELKKPVRLLGISISNLNTSETEDVFGQLRIDF